MRKAHAYDPIMYPNPPSPPQEPIAVVGSACRLAGGASSPSKLWRLLQEPRDLRRILPDSRFNPDGFYHPNGAYHGHANVRHAYLLEEDPAAFDAGFFGIKPAEAEAMDPQQRLLLEVVFEALESGGMPVGRLKGSDTAVYVGSMFDDYGAMLVRDLHDIPQYYPTGTGRSILANRISYFYDWHGPSISLDTACSSSLVAVHMAVQALRSRESRTAIASGANLILGPESFIVESKLGMLSPDGLGRMWDKGANGYARGEGVAAIVLKTLSAALEDGDHIECIIRETGLNTDGATPGGLTMPSAAAQEALIRSTYARAGLDLASPDGQPQYFEAHGTGTPAGDPIEAEAIYRAFSATRTPDAGPLYVGSIKTVLGHTEGTAGISAILKASLALQDSCVPPNMLLDQLSDKVAPFYQNVKILREVKPWPAVNTVRRASVNSFGFGGANAHAILESYDEKPFPNGETKLVKTGLPILFAFSAASRESLRAVLAAYLGFLEGDGASIEPCHLAWVLLQRRSILPWRVSFSASSTASLRDKIRAGLDKDPIIAVKALPESRSQLLGIFTGQGAQYARMGAELIEQSELASGMVQKFESYLAEIGEEERPLWSLREEILAAPSSSRMQEAAIAQPLATAVQIMLVDLLRLAGVQVNKVVGHSSGEIAAAYAAGFLSARDALLVAYFRGFHASRASRGAMLAVGTTSEDVAELCADRVFAGRVVLAAVNSPSSVTVSGDEDAIAELQLVLDDEKKFHRRLRVDKAYHSPQMSACVEPYMTSLRRSGVNPLKPKANAPTWYSSVFDGTVHDMISGLGDTYWADNMTRPVLFSQALESALTDRSGPCLAIELGAHPALKGPAIQTVQLILGKEVPYTGLLYREVDATEAVLTALGLLWSHLGPERVDIEGYQQAVTGKTHTFRMIKNLPTYPWDHKTRYWHESRSSRQLRLRQHPVNPLLGDESMDSAPHCMSWKHLLRVSEMEWLSGHRVQGQVVFPMAGYLATAFEAARILAANAGEDLRLIELKDFIIHQAVVLDHARGVEVMVSASEIAQKSRSQMTARFTYSATLAGKLTLVASSDLEVILGEPDVSLLPLRRPPTPHMIDVESERFYAALDGLGYNFSDQFCSIDALKRRNGIASCRVKAKAATDDELQQLLVHPVDLDGALQSLLLAYSYPYDEQLRALHLPTSIKRIRVNPALCGARDRTDGAFLTADAVIVPREAGERGVAGHVDVCSSKSPNVAIQVHQGTFMPFGEATTEQDRRVFSKVCWIDSQPDGLAAASGIDMAKSHREIEQLLERIATFYLRKTDSEVAQDHPQRSTFPHNRYLAFARHITSLVDTGQHKWAEGAWRDDTIKDILEASEPYHHLPDVEIMHLVGSHISRVLMGEVNMLEVFRADGSDILDRYYARGFGLSETSLWVARVVQQLVDRYPHMNMLELGAGTGGATKTIFREIGPSFASYTYTDISAGFFKTAATVFSRHSTRMIFKTLDAERDPIEQGFREGDYDLIVAFFVIHATSDLAQCLRNIRKLLRPGGFLVVGEGYEDGKYSVASSGYIFGTLPGWWLGAETGRSLSPHVTPQEWDTLLRSNGFSGVDQKPPADFCETFGTFPFLSQAVNDQVELLREPLASSPRAMSLISSLVIVGGITRRSSRLVQAVNDIFTKSNLAYSIHTFNSMMDIDFSLIDPKSTVISLSELDQPVFKDITEPVFHVLKKMFSSGKTLLWVTSGRLEDEPYSNMTVGFGRCAANETPDLMLQQLDIADPECADPKAIAEILARFQMSANEPTGERVLWSIEPEIVIDRAQRQLLARQRPIPELNDRYNSVNRSVIRDQDIGLSPVVVQPTSSGCTIKELRSHWRPRFDSMHVADVTELHTMQSVISALKTPFSYRYLVYGMENKSEKAFLALVPSLSSFVKIPSGTVVHVPQAKGTKVSIAQLLQSTAAHILAMSVLGALHSGQTIMAYNASITIAEALAAQARHMHVRVVFAADSDRMGCGSKTESWITLACNASQYEIEETLQLIEIAAFVDLSSSATGNGSLIEEAITSISRKGSRGCPIIIKARELYSNDYMGCGSVSLPSSSATILGNFLRQSLEFAQADAPTRDASVDPPLLRLDALARGECCYSDPLSVIDWTDVSPIPVQISRLDTGPMFRSSGHTYWVLGMTGALGLSLVDWMINKGARQVVMTSRNPDVSPDWIASHARRGAVVVVLACDVTDESALKAAHQTICYSMPPIAGVINGAMVLRDTSIRNMSFDQLTDVLGPKVDGSLHLDRLFAGVDLDFFVLISSINCVIGNWGQANYAAANTFMCSLAANRRKRGLRAAAVNGGAIVGAGYMERESRRALDQIVEKLHMMRLSEDDWCMSICEAIDACRLDSPHGPDISTGVSDVPFDVPNAPLWYSNPKFSSFISHWGRAQDHINGTAGSTEDVASVADRLAACKSPRDVLTVVREAFAAQLRSDLRIGMSDDDLMASRSSEIGLDSLVSVDVVSWFRKTLQVGIPVLRIMSNETLGSLVEHAAALVPVALLPGLIRENGVMDNEHASGVESRSMRASEGERPHANGVMIDWNTESRPPTFILGTSPSSGAPPAARPPRVIVLTGVTGLLGRHLLSHILSHPDVRKIICLAVRGLPSRLASGELPTSDSRLSYYEGDLSQPSLGLTPEQAASIFSEADAVIHNGADTSHMKTYAALKASNVGSTTALIALCLPRLVPIHYVSSAGLAVLYCSQTNGAAHNAQEGGFPDTAVPVFPEVSVADTPPTTEFLNFGYMCSKWVSERLLQKVVEDVEPRLRVSIHRPSTILRERGTWDAQEARSRLDWVNSLLQYARHLKAVPKIGSNVRGALDLVLVDSVCKGILREVFVDDLLEGGLRFVHEVGDVVIPLEGMESSEYLLQNDYIEKLKGNGGLTGAVNDAGRESFHILPMQAWITKATTAGMHPAVAELIQAIDAPGASAYPRLHKKTVYTRDTTK